MTTDPIQKRKQQLADLDDALTDEPVGYKDPHYFAFHQAAGRPRGVDPVADLCTAIEMKTKRTTCQLFSGFRGSGKSTELLRASGELAAAGHAVLFVSGNEVVNLSQPLEPTDLLVSVAAAVAVHVTKRRGASPAQQSLVRRLFDFFTKTEVDLTQIGLNTDPVKLTFALSRDPSFKARVQQALRGRLSEFAGQFQAFMEDAKRLLDVEDSGPSPVLIVDDLEKVRGLGKEQHIVQKGMEDIFWSFNWALRVEGWHAIWTAPPYIQLLNPRMGHHYDGSAVLPMVRVWDNDDTRTPQPQGIQAMRACARLRGDIDSLFLNQGLLDRLIMASSGHVRDFFGLLRDAVHQAYRQSDPSMPLNEPVIERIIGDYRSDYQKAIFDDDLPWLSSVALGRKLKLPSEDMLPRVAKLLDMSVVMTYRNGEDWVDLCAPAQGLV